MAKQTINVGTTANDRTGDPLRTAFTKVNSNFTELYANVATLNSSVVTDVSDLTDTQGLLFSGDYQDLANTPFIATDISDLTDSEDLLTVKDHITLNGIHQASNNVISFTKAPNTDANTVFDQISQFISITRDVGGIGGAGGGIYNRALEAEWDPAVSPLFTVWNAEGWDDLSDIEVRYYQPFRQALENNIGLNVVDKELIMKDTLLNEYYKVKFTTWAQGPSHTGAFAYTREKIDTTVPIGITFYNGSKLPKAPDTRLQFEQAYIGDYGDHVLTISEAGRQIYAYGNILEIPSYAEQDFKIGATIQIVTGATGSTLRPKVNGDVEIPDATLYIQDETTAATSFAIPARSMALLTKTRQNTWQLSIGDSSVAKTDFIPDTDNAYDLGSPTNQWKSLYVSANTIFVGGTPLSINESGTLLVDGQPVTGGGGGGSALEEPFEPKNSATGTVVHDCTTNRLFYHTSLSNNFTANFTNLGLAANESTSITLVLVQGVTGRMCTAVQIDGSAQTILWQGSASAPVGNASRTDVVTFSILCTATNTYTVLGMSTSFGGV